MKRFKTGDIVVNTQEDKWQGCVGVVSETRPYSWIGVCYFLVPAGVKHMDTFYTPSLSLQLLTPRSEASPDRTENVP